MIRIVIIEDESLVAADIQSRLRRAGYDIVGIASRGEDGIAKVDELLPDVVLVDIALKGEMDGIDAAQQIIERFDIPVIYVTVHTDAATVRRATATASYGFIVKPFNELELLAAIEMAVYKHGMEVKTRESDRRIRELTESLSEVIFEADMAGNITFINHAGLKEFGYTKEQVEGGVTLYDLIPPDKHEEIREAIAQPVIDEPSEWIEVPGVRRDGSTFPVAVRASLIVRGGVPVGIRGIALNVTEQKRAEQKLEESERHLYELTDSLPDIVLETDVGGTFTFLNRTGMDALGYTEDDLKKQVGFEDVIVPADRARVRENFKKRLERTPWEWVEYTALRKDGSTFPTSVRSTALMRDGVVVGVRSVAIDITEQKRAEQKLEESERHIRELTDALPVVVFETDATGQITFVNAMSVDLFGYTKEEFEAGMSWFQLIAPADLERSRTASSRRLHGDAIGPTEYTAQRKDGSTFPMSVRTVPIVRDGVYDGLRGVAIDITEQKRAEQKLGESEQHFREFAEALPELAFEVDREGRLTFANEGVLQALGISRDDADQHTVIPLVAPEEQQRAMAELQRELTGEQTAVRGSEFTVQRADGTTFPALIYSNPVRRDGAIVGVRGVAVDITEQKQLEERVEGHTHTIEILNRISTEGNRATDVQSFAEAATKSTCELMHFDIGGIYLIDADARYATLRYARGLSKTAQGAFEKIPCQDAPYNAILIDGEPLFAEDYVTFLPRDAPLGIVSLASVPLYSQDAVIGVLNVGSATPYTFSQAEKDLLVAIGNEVGTVMAKLQADELIKASLKERETLLKEIHHRVKNNMQIISSLLSLQAAQATERETVDMLGESQRRIRSMALIHEKLYRSGSLAEIEFGDYVESLTDELLRMCNVAEGAITITTDIENVRLGVDTAVPCALLINELVSNCLKHAFPDGRTGDVTVALQRANGAHTLTVADNGVGFPADVDFRTTDSLGMQLVVTLVGQLDGTITLDRANGTTFIITFEPEGAHVRTSGEK